MTSLCCNILTACIATSFNGFVFNVPAQNVFNVPAQNVFNVPAQNVFNVPVK